MQNHHENSLFSPNYSLNIKGKLIDFSTVKLMGVLNLTPDSFFDGGKFNSEKKVLNRIETMLSEGADIIDIGAFSSRPGAKMINEDEELKRLLPSLELITKNFPEAIISVDTYRSEIARKSAENGASIINDISAGSFDDKMFSTVAELKMPFILMHMQGNPEGMQDKPEYNNVVNEIFNFFTIKLEQLIQVGVNDIILDPGFGFGKSLEHNYQLLNQLSYFHKLKYPLLVGVSRKGMIQKVINQQAENALNGTTAAHVIALLNGANILRVHDVSAAKEAIQIVDFYQKQ